MSQSLRIGFQTYYVGPQLVQDLVNAHSIQMMTIHSMSLFAV
jgi:hypothetical protein